MLWCYGVVVVLHCGGELYHGECSVFCCGRGGGGGGSGGGSGGGGEYDFKALCGGGFKQFIYGKRVREKER